MNPEDNNNNDYSQQQDYQSQQNYGETHYDGQDYQNHYGRNPQPVSGMSIAALILGCLSILTSCCGIGGIIFGSLGIIIAMMSKSREPMQTNSKIGLGLSIAGLIFSLIFGILMIAGIYLYSSDNLKEYYQEYDYYEEQPYNSYEYTDGYQYMPYRDNLNGLREQYESKDV